MTNSDPDFLKLVAAADFPRRYYALCEQFPFGRFTPAPCTKNDVTRILSELGHTARWDSRNRSYSIPFPLSGWDCGSGFRILYRTDVEFWIRASRAAEHHGDSFARLANYATKLTTPEKMPSPPFPLPNFRSLSALKDILAACFDLTQVLIPLLERLPNSTNA